MMKRGVRDHSGMELLLEKYRAIFRTPENVNHYSPRDLEIAERKFLKYALTHRIVGLEENLSDLQARDGAKA